MSVSASFVVEDGDEWLVRSRQLLPGDLVFFEQLGHVGIYLGHDRFIHPPHTGTVVGIDELTGSQSASYVGAT